MSQDAGLPSSFGPCTSATESTTSPLTAIEASHPPARLSTDTDTDTTVSRRIVAHAEAVPPVPLSLRQGPEHTLTVPSDAVRLSAATIPEHHGSSGGAPATPSCSVPAAGAGLAPEARVPVLDFAGTAKRRPIASPSPSELLGSTARSPARTQRESRGPSSSHRWLAAASAVSAGTVLGQESDVCRIRPTDGATPQPENQDRPVGDEAGSPSNVMPGSCDAHCASSESSFANPAELAAAPSHATTGQRASTQPEGRRVIDSTARCE